MRTMPENLVDAYTLNGKIPVVDYYFNEGADRKYFHYSKGLIGEFFNKAKNKETLHYAETDPFLYEALDKYPIKEKSVLIIGSVEPCYEALAFHYGAKEVMMIEYQKVTADYPNLSTLTVEEFSQLNDQYDVAISISSVEHSGLGRYGDELDPEGDLKAMEDLYSNLKDGGACFLAVPMGADRVEWNAHRVYGSIRFPMLVSKFEIIDKFGWEEADLDRAERFQPVT
ncbi:hypothetical protein CL634_11270, partial [bacterium]|nr:hypothetical protein [bacterium]